MVRFFDTHAHLDYQEFDSDLTEVIQRAENAGIQKIISIGTDFQSSRTILELSRRFPAVYAVVGWHPTQVEQAPEDIRSELRQLAREPKVVAIGETGLDYHRLPSSREEPLNADADDAYKTRQLDLFRQHLEVAAELGLSCVVHQRDALDDTTAEMEKWAGDVRGVFHCFVDSSTAMHRILSTGSLVSFTGIVTFKNAATVRDTLAATPLGSFMLETDAPFLAPVPYRGKRCEPAYVEHIAAVAAEVKGCSLEELSQATCQAAERFFVGLDHDS